MHRTIIDFKVSTNDHASQQLCGCLAPTRALDSHGEPALFFCGACPVWIVTLGPVAHFQGLSSSHVTQSLACRFWLVVYF